MTLVAHRSRPSSVYVDALSAKTVSKIPARSKMCIRDRYYIVGENFTKSSQVYINEHSEDTTFISDTVLLLDNGKLEEGDQINVRQITSDFIELGASDSYIYTDTQRPAEATMDEAED